MAIATYPRAVRVFSEKVDNRDTNYAAHINDLQAEVAALQTVLGINPQKDATINGVGKDYGTVAARLDALGSRGIDRPFVQAGCSGITTASGVNSLLSFNIEYQDPLNWFTPSVNTFAVFVQRTGFYIVNGDVTYNGPASSINQNTVRVSTLGLNGVLYKQATTVFPPNMVTGNIPNTPNALDVTQDLTAEMYLQAGWHLTLVAFQNRGDTMTATGHLSVVHVRD
jgi:hypothetical protein